MQQQVNSYTFQLSQNLERSVLQCHTSEPLFYMGGVLHNKTSKNNKSSLYRLHFDEQNPRKSEVKKQQIPGSIQAIHSISKDSQDLIIISKDNSGVYSFSKATYPLLEDQIIKLQTLNVSSDSKISLISHKQSKKYFLVGQKQIHAINQQNFSKGQQLIQVEQNKQITSSIIDPIHELLTYVVDGKQIIITDKTFKKQKFALRIGQNDLSSITSIDYNPNKQYYLMSCHNECLKFWDIRKQNLPVKVYAEHHALVLNAKYNNSHDELISCSYDDGTIGLLRMNSVSSSPGQNEDTVVKLYDQHQDSVYSVKWANFSPWIFASLSYSAASVVINFVPSVQKYRILL